MSLAAATVRARPPVRRPAAGVAMILGGAMLFAVNGTVAKLVLRAGIDAPQLATLRASGAALALCVVALVLRPRSMRITRGEVPMLAVYGLAGFLIVPLLYLVAIGRLAVGLALLLEYMAPILVAVWARFVQRRRVRRRLWAGLAFAVGGLACVAEVWGGSGLDPVGIAAGLTAAVLLAAYFLLGAKGVASRDSLSLTAWAFVFAALAGAAIRPWWSFPFGDFDPRTALLAGYVVIFGTTVPYLLLAAALTHLPATSVSIISMAEVVLAAAVAWVVLDEVLPPVQLAGGVLILVGIVLAETARVPELEHAAPHRRTGGGRMAAMPVHPNVQAVQDVLDTVGARRADGTPSQVRTLPAAVHTAVAAAAALGVEVGQIANSLIFDADGAPLLVLTSGAHRANPVRLAELAGVTAVRRAAPDFVRRHTGQVIGGVAPVHPTVDGPQMRTLVDKALFDYDEVWAAGGIPQAVFPVTPDELRRLTGGDLTDVA